ncbi:MAG: hypothetical protein Q9168_006616 [Polycauliona sp. 1 TL-2023]
MDMRNLHTSLPRSNTAQQPSEQLHQAFKTAALSITKLYKTATLEQAGARQTGYQEALDDILAFLDKQHLGLGDGEGWRVRQWATERLDGSAADRTAASESDDERAETEKRARSSSPVVSHKSSAADVLRPPETRLPERIASAPPVQQEIPQLPPTSHPKSASEIFTFRSSHPYPQDVDMVASDSTAGTSTAGGVSQSEIQNVPPIPQPSPTLRVGVLPRGARTPHRTGTNKHNTRGVIFPNRRSLGTGAGSKRKLDFNEYFDVSSLGEGRDGGGGKKGRLS